MTYLFTSYNDSLHKALRRIFLAEILILVVISLPAAAQTFKARSQVNPNFFGQGDYKLLNRVKTMPQWIYKDNSGKPSPSELDDNGFPLYGANGFYHNGFYSVSFEPSQAERPGNYVLTWIGGGTLYAYDNNGTTTNVSCTGAVRRGACSNAGCTTADGYISGTTLVVTSASTCSFVRGQPISGAGVAISRFGVPTIITNTNGNAGAGIYAVNFPQTVGSARKPIRIYPGGRAVYSPGTESTTSNAEWTLWIEATKNQDAAQYYGLYHSNDEETYWSGQIVGTLFKQRIAQGNFKVVRDLNLTSANTANCTTWATRKPTTYFSYNAPEMRSKLVPSKVTYDVKADTYNVTFGSGNWTDKLTLILKWPATGGAGSKISLNGNLAVPLFNLNGNGRTVPTTGHWVGTVYDATLGGVLVWESGNYNGLNCGMPPEAVIEFNHELGTDPWIVAFYMAVDPMTDFYTRYADYIKAHYPQMHPWFETPDETWNCAGQGNPANYFSAKSRAYIALDRAWNSANGWCGSGGDFTAETGKVASTLGQAIRAIYPASEAEVIAGVQTNYGSGGYNADFSQVMTSADYVNQNPANIPIQSGYTQTPAYNYVSYVGISNYWSLSGAGTQAEVAKAYCYFYQSSGCATRATILANYMATQDITVGAPSQATRWENWNLWATSCGVHLRRCGVRGAVAYEGGFANPLASSDASVAFVSARTNANSCVLGMAPGNGDGAVIGQTVAISYSGGSNANLVVQAQSSDSITVNVTCPPLGSFSSGRLIYTGSKNYINVLREASYLAPQLFGLTLLNYSRFVEEGGINPSQFTLAGIYSLSYPWFVWANDIYGYFPLASCTACTISGTTLTLGGTITGIFAPGQTLFGRGVSGVGSRASSNTTIVGSCSTSGSYPCGSNSGDTLKLSQPSTVGSGTVISGNVTPPLDPAGSTANSPVTAWPAIRQWNRNSGGDLLRRDLDPASNDDTPAFLDKAA